MTDLGGVWALLPLAGAGFGVGFLVGLTGVGGGALMTPLLISTFGVAPAVAVGTDLLYAAVTKTVGGWRHHVAENVDWPIVFRLAAGSIPAAIVLYYIFALGLPDEVMLFLPGACMPLVICDLRQKGLLAWGILLPVTAAMHAGWRA